MNTCKTWRRCKNGSIGGSSEASIQLAWRWNSGSIMTTSLPDKSSRVLAYNGSSPESLVFYLRAFATLLSLVVWSPFLFKTPFSFDIFHLQIIWYPMCTFFSFWIYNHTVYLSMHVTAMQVALFKSSRLRINKHMNALYIRIEWLMHWRNVR